MAIADRSEAGSWSIMPVAGDDYDEIVKVWREAGLSVRRSGRDARLAFVQQLSHFPDLYLKAVIDGRIVGVIFGTHDWRKGWINRLAVLPECRRRGVGAALLLAGDEAIRGHGIGIVSALIEADNRTSATFFEKMGYLADVPVIYYRKLDRADI